MVEDLAHKEEGRWLVATAYSKDQKEEDAHSQEVVPCKGLEAAFKVDSHRSSPISLGLSKVGLHSKVEAGEIDAVSNLDSLLDFISVVKNDDALHLYYLSHLHVHLLSSK